ncbi:MAG: amidohydrolase family protein [Mariniblastus sp.]|nr:amidohydrolase family protein [Mariniblastus sp.]
MKRLIIQFTTAGLIFFLLAAPQLAHAEDSILISADTVYTMNGKTLSPGQVLVVDGKIKAVGKTVSAADSSTQEIKLGPGSVLMPGLVDPYSQTGLGDDGTDERTEEITPNFKAIHSVDWEKSALRRQRENGTTTMCVSPGRQNVFGGITAIIKTYDAGNPILNEDGALIASMCSDPTASNRSRSRPDTIFVRQPTNRMGVVWMLRSTFDKVNRASAGESEFPEIKQVLTGKRPLMIYARMSHDITTVETLANTFKLSPIIVGGHEAYKVKEMLAERKYPVILDRIDTRATTGAEQSKLCWNQAAVLDQAGVTFALCGNDLLDQARFVHRHGLSREKTLAAITATPAKLLGVQDKVGMIKPKLDADLIAFSGDPLDLTSRIQWVMVNGQVLAHSKSITETNEKNNDAKLGGDSVKTKEGN